MLALPDLSLKGLEKGLKTHDIKIKKEKIEIGAISEN